jgi:hypothetical protein
MIIWEAAEAGFRGSLMGKGLEVFAEEACYPFQEAAWVWEACFQSEEVACFREEASFLGILL